MTTESPETQSPPDRPKPNAVPVKIHLLNGKTFVVDAIESWLYEEQGVFATGNFEGYSGDRDVLIPYDRIDYYEFDFKRLTKHLVGIAEEAAPDASPSA